MQNLSGTVFNITEFEDTKGAMGTCISKKNRQHMAKRKAQKDKQRSTKHAHKTKDRVTRTPLKKNSCSGTAYLCYRRNNMQGK